MTKLDQAERRTAEDLIRDLECGAIRVETAQECDQRAALTRVERRTADRVVVLLARHALDAAERRRRAAVIRLLRSGHESAQPWIDRLSGDHSARVIRWAV